MSESFGDGGMAPSRGTGRDGGMRPAGSGLLVPVDAALETDSRPTAAELEIAKDYGKLNLVLGARWQPGHWDPVLRAMPILAVFARSGWESTILAPPKHDAATLGTEIKSLVELIPMRTRRMDEILVQSGDPARYWAQLFCMTPASHPATWTLLSAAMAVAHMVGMHWKSVYNRPRPSQVYPGLVPPIPVPPHPSYPSGHALHARLIQKCLVEACPAMQDASEKLASRLGQNRQVAGVHYPSDTAASISLVNGTSEHVSSGKGIWDHLKPVLQQEIWKGEPSPLAAAQQEWTNVTTGGLPA